MTTKMKQLLGFSALGCLAILALGWFLLISPKKADVKTVQGQTAAVLAKNTTLQQQIVQLTQQQQGLITKQVELSKVAQRIPSNEQLPSVFRSIVDMGAQTGVDVVTITPGTPTAPAAAAATTTAAGTTAGSAAAAPATYSTDPVVLSVQGSYSQLVMFLDKLETQQRLWVVKSLNVTPLNASKDQVTYAPNGTVEASDDLAATITGEVYQTSADTTTIDLPALQGASGTTTAGSSSSSTTTSSTTTTN